MKGWVSTVHRCSRHDGPGLRTTIFLQGCHLRCQWCHNPETWSPKGALAFEPGECMECGGCSLGCELGLHRKGPMAQPKSCSACGDCTDLCPTGALNWKGNLTDLEELMDTLEKDRVLLESSSGGLTLSGGEPLDQRDFSVALLKEAKFRGFHTLLDTSLHASQKAVLEVCPHTDLFFVDWKCSSPSKHRELTGVDQETIVMNLELLHQQTKDVHLRCPLVPGINDQEEHFSTIRQLKSRFSNIVQVEFLPYHRHGQGKAIAMGLGSEILDIPSAGEDDHQRWLEELSRYELIDSIHPFLTGNTST